jgi:histone H3/H4
LRQAKHYRVFLSGPFDVAADIDVVRETLDGINILLESFNVSFDAVHWRKSVSPGVDVEPQARINEQVGGYDIIIALIGARLGSPTRGHRSGTVEEIERALASIEELPFRGSSIMVLFKSIGLNSMTSDLGAAAAVQEFRRSLGGRGVLFGEFSDEVDLRISVMRAIGRILPDTFDLQRAAVEPTLAASVSPSEQTSVIDEEDDLGWLDFQDLIRERLASSTAAIEEIANAMQKYTEIISSHSAALASATERQDQKAARKGIDDISQAMVELSSLIETCSASMASDYISAMDALSKARAMQSVDGIVESDEDIDKFREAISFVILNVKENSESTDSVAETVTTLPRVTKEFNRSKRELLQTLGNYGERLSEIVQRSEDMLSRL